ncbi:MAG: hypothetical protein AAGI63_19775 [Planctomycetota bacterium]
MSENPYEPPTEMPAHFQQVEQAQPSINARTRLVSGLSGIMVLGMGAVLLGKLPSFFWMLIHSCVIIALAGWLMWNAVFLKD